MLHRTRKNHLFLTSMLAGMIGLSSAPGLAQDASGDTRADDDDEVIVVTGSRLRRNEFTSASPVQIVTAEEATLEGLVDAAEMLQGSSVASGSAQYNNQFGGYVVSGGTGINTISLRGLGAQRSLVLVNGLRLGPAGVRGEVGAFDLNVLPPAVVNRFDILKDGASSVYGSDAVAGVVNVVTLDRVDRPELTVSVNAPFEGGGETYDISGLYGLDFDNGHVVLAAQYQLREDLSLGDRDYLACQQDLVYDAPGGNRIDREDRSILAGTELSGCDNIYFNTVFDQILGGRYIPDPDGVGTPELPGYRKRVVGRYDTHGQAFYESVTNDARFLSSDAINRQERSSLFASADFDFDVLGGVNWRADALFTRRETASEGWRQFFPLIGGASAQAGLGTYGYANDPGYDNPLILALPVTLWPSNYDADVRYTSLNSTFSGELGTGFGPFTGWGWTLSAQYSRSEGHYTNNAIRASASGDVRYTDDAPFYDPFSADFLAGNYSDDLFDALTIIATGLTVYEQTVVTASIAGDLFELPAGPVSAALGAERRGFSIDDTPAEESRSGELWNSTSAQITRGEDNVSEIFGEVELPLLADQPLAQSVTLNLSGRAFDYETAGSDAVWKAGLNWQITPSVRLRATQGTSYRAPALYELYLGNQSSFLAQLSIDPCIDWALSNDEDIRRNCAAEGIPGDYIGAASGATIYTGGGEGVLESETSESRTLGIVYTPDWFPVSVAVDYFELEVFDQVSQLGAQAIIGGCYGASNYPNAFCDLFDRNTGSAAIDPFAITEVRDSYINVNSQYTSGVDLTVRYADEFAFGDVHVDLQTTWTLDDVVYLFDPTIASGYANNDFNGTIGDPQFVANMRTSLTRGAWTYSWFMDYVDGTTDPDRNSRTFNYEGWDNAFRDLNIEGVVYHDASVRWEGDSLTIQGGISNLFDEHPPTVSDPIQRRGNTALSGTQYDLRGRTGFVRVTKRF
jgi:iron complex outermembrane receptor protein